MRLTSLVEVSPSVIARMISNLFILSPPLSLAPIVSAFKSRFCLSSWVFLLSAMLFASTFLDVIGNVDVHGRGGGGGGGGGAGGVQNSCDAIRG